MALLFSRNAKVYIEIDNGTVAGSSSPALEYVWEVPVLDGFSFSQASESQEIVASEAGSDPARGRLLFNTALNPVEWSFSTYIRPFKTSGAGTGGTLDGNANDIHAVEEILWAMLFGANTFTPGTATFSKSGGSAFHTPVDGKFTLAASNVASFADNFNLYFAFEPSTSSVEKVYKLTQAVVNSATVDFDIEGIATIQWSGFAKAIVDSATTKPSRDYYEKITDTSTFIRNKLSTLALVKKYESPNVTYSINITGGSITFENNITYLTPEEIGIVNQPFANIAGTRSISGNLTCYLDTTSNKSSTLYSDLTTDTSVIRNNFDMAISVGGTTGNRLLFDLPTAHLEIPNISIEDLVTLDVTFHAQPSTNTFDSTGEAFIQYGTA